MLEKIEVFYFRVNGYKVLVFGFSSFISFFGSEFVEYDEEVEVNLLKRGLFWGFLESFGYIGFLDRIFDLVLDRIFCDLDVLMMVYFYRNFRVSFSSIMLDLFLWECEYIIWIVFLWICIRNEWVLKEKIIVIFILNCWLYV